jgi:hypothetical protein
MMLAHHELGTSAAILTRSRAAIGNEALTKIVASYAPYHMMESFGEGFVAYQQICCLKNRISTLLMHFFRLISLARLRRPDTTPHGPCLADDTLDAPAGPG